MSTCKREMSTICEVWNMIFDGEGEAKGGRGRIGEYKIGVAKTTTKAQQRAGTTMNDVLRSN